MTFWVTTGFVQSLTVMPCFAYSRDMYVHNAAPDKVLQNPYDPQTRYLMNRRGIDQQLERFVKPLSHLSVVDPLGYSQIQYKLNGYLNQLKRDRVDYSNMDVYRKVQLDLIRFRDQINVLLVESRRLTHEQGGRPNVRKSFPKGHKVLVRPYAMLFKKPDYHSARQHTVKTNESVVILEDKGSYCLVQCAVHQGYLSKGMIVEAHP